MPNCAYTLGQACARSSCRAPATSQVPKTRALRRSCRPQGLPGKACPGASSWQPGTTMTAAAVGILRAARPAFSEHCLARLCMGGSTPSCILAREQACAKCFYQAHKTSALCRSCTLSARRPRTRFAQALPHSQEIRDSWQPASKMVATALG